MMCKLIHRSIVTLLELESFLGSKSNSISKNNPLRFDLPVNKLYSIIIYICKTENGCHQ